MNKKSKIVLFILSIVVMIVIGLLCYNTYKSGKKENTILPLSLTLKGKEIITMKAGEVYQEPGYIAFDKEEGDISSQVTIQSTLDVWKPGTYQITYTITNENGEKTEAKRFVKVEGEANITYKESYDKIDNQLRTWWSGNKKNHTRPVDGAGNTEEILKKYNAYYMGKDEKIIYLTFDEGSNDTYTNEIVDVLNQNNVKATFFLCKGFIESNPELMKKLASTGHSVGNHTANHKSMPTLANRNNFEKYLQELKSNEEAYRNITGVSMDKVYREPKGEYSYRSLQIVHDLGYKTFFWSADHYDFDYDVSKEKALEALTKRYHNGAIYLIHPKNKGNYQALDTFIKNMKELGFSFGLVRDIK